jgi:hypothetical protein
MVARILVGLMAAFYFLMGVLFWFQLDTQAANFAVDAVGELGRASIRADFGSFFLSIGILCAYASWKQYGAATGAAADLDHATAAATYANVDIDVCTEIGAASVAATDVDHKYSTIDVGTWVNCGYHC